MVDAGEGMVVPQSEVEKQQEHPLVVLDAVMKEVSDQDFSGDQRVEDALRYTSVGLRAEAQNWTDYFTGKADPKKYSGYPPEEIRELAGNVSPSYNSEALTLLGPDQSERVVTAIAKRLGILNGDHTSLAALQETRGWRHHFGGRGSISVPLENKNNNSVLIDPNDMRQYDYPLLQLNKQSTGYGRAQDPGYWSIGMYLPPKVFDKSLDMPLPPSPFTVTPSATPAA